MKQNLFGYCESTQKTIITDITKRRVYKNEVLHARTSLVPTFIPFLIPLPSIFLSILTYNIWMLQKYTYSRYEQRTGYLLKLLEDTDADIICLQEVGQYFLRELLNSPLHEKYVFTETSVESVSWNYERGDVICVTLIKSWLRPIKTIKHTIHIGLFKCDIIETHTEKSVIVNLILHPGSSFSPDINLQFVDLYSQCRKNQLEYIISTICEHITDKDIFLCGDFNFDLNPSGKEAFQKEHETLITKLKHNGYCDTAFKMYDKNFFTEDTEKNEMRWNIKKKTKRMRFDGIFVKTAETESKELCFQPTLIGTEPIFRVSFNEFIESLRDFGFNIENLSKTPFKMRAYDNTMINWYASDHFGYFVSIFILS